MLAIDAFDLDGLGLEQDLRIVGEPARDQILHDLLLAIDGDAATDQLAEIDTVQLAVERKIGAVVKQRLALHACPDAGRDQEIDHPLLDQSGTNARFAIVAAARLDDDAFDAGEVQEMRQHQPRWARAHDPDLSPHVLPWILFRYPVLGGVPIPVKGR